MIHVDFDPKDLPPDQKAQWDQWMQEAKAAQLDVINQWEDWRTTIWAKWKKKKKGERPEFSPEWDNDVWKKLRDWLLTNVFHNKCAYCEMEVVGFPGDAEHFRPKGRVRIKVDKQGAEVVMIVDEDGDEIPHPGYFWLAYHWKNLLPACETCNRGEGKKDFFPAKKHVGVRRLTVNEIDSLLEKITKSQKANDIFYLEPDDLDVIENRLLLHPYIDKPKEHIYFKNDGEAAVRSGSEKGSESIRTYNLNDPKRKGQRNRAQFDGFRYYKDEVLPAVPDLAKAELAAQRVKNEYYHGPMPYAAAVFDYIHMYLENSPLDPDILLKETQQQDQP